MYPYLFKTAFPLFKQLSTSLQAENTKQNRNRYARNRIYILILSIIIVHIMLT